jgi:hypothetical protein
MKRSCVHLFILFLAVVALSPAASSQEKMTAERFRQIASNAGDNIRLDPKLLAIGPLWTNATITLDMKYADGRNINQKFAASLKTVRGKYVVATIHSDDDKQPANSITTYDAKSGCYKFWGLYGDTTTQGSTVYNLDKKIYSTYSTYGEGYVEMGVGAYTDTNNWSHTVVLKDGVLFSTRDVTVVPAKPIAK